MTSSHAVKPRGHRSRGVHQPRTHAVSPPRASTLPTLAGETVRSNTASSAPYYPFYVANQPRYSTARFEVLDKYSQETVAEIAVPAPSDIEEAIAAAADARMTMQRMRSFERRDILLRCASQFDARREELAQSVCAEAGKPIANAREEVDRLVATFRLAAEESTRRYGEVIPMDLAPHSSGYCGQTKPVPIGLCSFITPFNYPLNIVAHKVAPALAVGCPFVLKPSLNAPLGALHIGEILADTDLPSGAFSILPCQDADAAPLIEDERINLLSFTGSHRVGWRLKSRAGRKKVLLELGGNAAVVVDKTADVETAVQRIVCGAFRYSGQSCISVQRILIHREIYEEVRDKLIAKTSMLPVGDPKDERTMIGPLISVDAATRVHAWIESARSGQGVLLTGGGRNGAIVEPTLLENVPESDPIVREEVFGPVATLSPFDDFEEALDRVNASKFGLQAGVFTNDIRKAHLAWDTLEVGCVVIGDVASWRVDHTPYGGVKHSGLGREGVRFAMAAMSEIRMMICRTDGA